jgi:hypothetical protein
MTKVRVDITTSLDGFVAGPNQTSADSDVLEESQAATGAVVMGRRMFSGAALLLGGGVRLFGELDPIVELEATRVIESPAVAHLRYRVAASAVG